MLGFKFINDISSQGVTGPVPVVGVFGGSKHSPNMNYNNTIFDRSTFAIVLSAAVGRLKQGECSISYQTGFDPGFNRIDNNWNLLKDSEDIGTGSHWTVGGNSGGDTIVVTDYIVAGAAEPEEAPLTTSPAKKITTTGNSTIKTILQNIDLGTTSSRHYTASVFLSYGEIGDHPNHSGGATYMNVDDVNDVNGSTKFSLIVVWKDDGSITLIPNNCYDQGFEKFTIGDRVWYRVWWTGKAVQATDIFLKITPTGWVDLNSLNAPEGWLLMAHPQVTELGFDPATSVDGADITMKPLLTPYSLSYGDYNKTFPNLLAGPQDANMTVPVADNQIIFDAETNKPYTNYTQGNNKLYISTQDYKEKYLIYRDSDEQYKLVKGHNRFPVIKSPPGSDSMVYIANIDAPGVTIRQNPLDMFEMYVPIRDNKHSWKLTYNKTIELIDGNLLKIHGGTARETIVWDEKPKKITNKLLKLSEKGILSWRYDESWISSDSSYFLKEIGSIKILLNYDIELSDIDIDKGLLLFKNDVPEDIKVTYCLNDNWEVIPVELNPVIKQNLSNGQSTGYSPPLEIKIKIDKTDGSIYYELDSSGQILQNGYQPNAIQDALAYERYTDIATVTFDYDKPELIDVRREGGMLIDKNEAEWEIRSHNTWGFMGVDPTELNIAIVKIPDEALETLLYQFQEEHPNYDPNNVITFPLDWDTNRQTYLNFIKDNPDEQNIGNPIKEELLLYSKRVLPAGVRAAIVDKLDNIIFYDADNSESYGDFL